MSVLFDLDFNKVYEQENETKYYKERAQIHEEMDKKEVLDICGESQTMTSDHWKAEQKKSKKTTIRRRAKQLLEKQIKISEDFFAENLNRETSRQDERPDDNEEK